MAITSYASLKDEIAAWMTRGNLSAYLDTAIDNAEGRFNYGAGGEAGFPSDPIRTRDMIATQELTLTDGAAALPEDFLEARRVTALTSPRRKLEYASADWLDEACPETGPASFYTLLGASLIVRPLTGSAIELSYHAKIPALSDAAPVNWLLARHPNIYLYACLLEANLLIRNLEQAGNWYRLTAGAIGGLMRTEMRAAPTIPARRAAGVVA